MADTPRVGLLIAGSEPRVDVLINNAGAMFANREVTSEGLELTFALNHMAYFVMTAALDERLAAAAPARVVSTSSMAHQGASLDLSDLQSAKNYNGWRAYARSKLANVLFTREAARRFSGVGVTANCFHPGFVASRFGSASGGWTSRLMPFAQAFAISPQRGADTLIYLASSPEVAKVSGAFFARRKIIQPSAAARDDAAARKLWEASEALAGPRS